MSRSGRYVAMGQGDGVHARVALVDAMGTAPRRRLDARGLQDFACVDDELWIAAAGTLRRHALADGSPVGAPLALDESRGRLLAAQRGRGALWLGDRSLLIRASDDGDATAREVDRDIGGNIGASACVGLLGGARLAVADGPLLRLCDAGRGEVMRVSLPLPGADPGRVVGCWHLFDERALAVLVAGASEACVLVLRPDGALVHRIPVPACGPWAVAESRGRALLHVPPASPEAPVPGRLLSVDLRYGKLLDRVDAPIAIEALAVDADARYLVLAGAPLPPEDPEDLDGHGEDEDAGALDAGAGAAQPAILHLAYAELLGGSRARSAGASGEVGDLLADEPPAGAPPGDDASAGPEAGPEAGPAPPLDAASHQAPPEPAPAPAAEEVTIPDGPLLALGLPRTLPDIEDPPDVPPYASAGECMEAMLDLVTAQVTQGIAEAWDRGELSPPADGRWPFERMVTGLAGDAEGLAPDILAATAVELERLSFELGERMVATLAAGRVPALVAVSRELGLSTLDGQVMLLAAAPMLRGEIARLYTILANDPRRPTCDVHLVEHIAAGRDWLKRREVAEALAPESKLVRAGLIVLGDPPAPGHAGPASPRVTADPALVARLRGGSLAGVAAVRYAARPLEELCLPRALARELVLALAEPPRDGAPVRVVLRGRRGSGRRTLAAALTARVERPVAIIDCARLPRSGVALARVLHTELCRAVIAGAVPCVSGLEVLGADDVEGLAHVRAVLRAHPAPVLVRASPDLVPPLDPGYLDFTLPGLDETTRLGFWRETLARYGLRAEGEERLAARFRVGPGSIEDAARTVAARGVGAPADRGAGDDRAAGGGAMRDTAKVAHDRGADDPGAGHDATEALDAAMRQHIQIRMGSIATHITRLARWDQVAIPDELRDSVRELIGRVRQRRQVYERWGFERRLHSSRGLSALFYGPPGVGKTMVAGLIARDLGLDLYRVDLAQVTSKWIGETEKNLAEIFEAGEDGQVVILFDEADSLFAKRTEVQSSVDRHANQQVNYLLQRLDTFDGVAILTTNREGAIDKAFKRRMTMRLAFPFPDEEMRARLWAAHIPEGIPRQGAFDLDELARRFPLSGGYIRNCALRAAFLAAAEDAPLTQAHLVRAIELEYHEMGKLAPSGRLE